MVFDPLHVPYMIYMILQLRGFARSRDEYNTLYLHLERTNGNQTRQGDDLTWEALIMKTTWPLDHVTKAMSHATLKNLYLQLHKTYLH